MKRVLITGATGTIGQSVVKHCRENNIAVNYLTTSNSKIINSPEYQGFYWNPETGEIDTNCLLGVESIIHLAGATVSKRWTKSYKEEIIESRIVSANLLFNTLKKQEHNVKQFISASGVGIYKSDYEKLYTEEDTETDASFLAEVVISWEAVTEKFSTEGIAVTIVRTGVVLDSDDGALPKLSQPIKLGFGAALGSGKQWQSWIHIDDIARIYVHILNNKFSGIFNAVSPNPVTNAEMTKTIATVLKKPLWLPGVPAFVLKLLLGEMSVMVLSSQKVSATKIEDTGFAFQFPDLEGALKNLLK